MNPHLDRITLSLDYLPHFHLILLALDHLQIKELAQAVLHIPMDQFISLEGNVDNID